MCVLCSFPFILIVPDEVMFDDGLPFYDLRGIPGLGELPRVQDSHSPEIFLPNGGSLVYGNIVTRIIYVSQFRD